MADLLKASHILAVAGVRYWEDATVNGVEDADGALIPGRIGDDWCVTIELATGRILDWPDGTTASIHYKVCDDGRYWLLDADGNDLAAYNSCYVPNAFMCHGDDGFGDYIIMDVGPDGQIADYVRPRIDPSRWTEVE